MEWSSQLNKVCSQGSSISGKFCLLKAIRDYNLAIVKASKNIILPSKTRREKHFNFNRTSNASYVNTACFVLYGITDLGLIKFLDVTSLE